MKHLKLLVVINGPDRSDRGSIEANINFFVNRISKDLSNHIVYEDLVASKQSHLLKDKAKEFGYVLIIGRAAYEKVQEQIAGTSLLVQKLPGFPSWSNNTNRKAVAAQIAELFKQWDSFAIEKMLLVVPVAQESPEEATQDRAEWIEANLTDFERYLEMQLTNSRYQACIFRIVDDANPFMEVVDATRKLRVPIKDVTPILVDPEVLKDKDAVASIVTRVKKNGFQDPYLLPIRDFIVLVRICCQLSRSGRARLEIALEPKNEQEEKV